MKLELSDGTTIKDPSLGDIEREVSRLADDPEFFAILSVAEMTYIQTAGSNKDGFVLEYQVKVLENHYISAERTTLDQVLVALKKYARGDESWKSDFAWEKMGLSNGKSGCLGLALLAMASLGSAVTLMG